MEQRSKKGGNAASQNGPTGQGQRTAAAPALAPNFTMARKGASSSVKARAFDDYLGVRRWTLAEPAEHSRLLRNRDLEMANDAERVKITSPEFNTRHCDSVRALSFPCACVKAGYIDSDSDLFIIFLAS
ncbi:uncharacterized protein UMAG_05124 [Mycosarcoma maydis]|uniref:Uncharacterized protein n=1 Tax=Mycosarcoma maydis TaxID=5270 RepID=A0A0D1E6P3_MYCMD|nr:uncharacterized protein UMAG_05124 [Ustilago maydis 521]KIS70050.1 hypothetical protein UMAG_05124 [Ustilago maydis 521]|eukprot:XP_011388189.1 hypothetical protein UMAG_05124 [Ustilago maydis 521]